MIINLKSYIRPDQTLSLERDGSTLIINGDRLELDGFGLGTVIKDVEQLHPFLLDKIEVTAQGPVINVLFPVHEQAPNEIKFPAPIVDPGNGVIDLPHWEPEPESDDEED